MIVAALLAAGLMLTAGASPAHAACVPTRDVFAHLSGSTVLDARWNYANCSVPDLDQVRSAGPGGDGALPSDGVMYCVPTSAMDWMTWLSVWGVLSRPVNVDWTKPANFNPMSRNIELMGQAMGTDPAGGTNGGGEIAGLSAWLNSFRQTPPLVDQVIFGVGQVGPDPHVMAVLATLGAVISVDIAWIGSDGTRGGHQVALQATKGNASVGTLVFHVMDPNNPKVYDHTQSPYHADRWVMTYDGAGGWNLTSSDYTYPDGTWFAGYTELVAAEVLSGDAPNLIIDKPLQLIESRKHGRTSTRIPLRGKGRVLDLAIQPGGIADPYVRAGSNAVWSFSRVDHRSTKFAAGPAHPNHLTYGGPDRTLFVSGSKTLVALDQHGHRVASADLKAPLDSLAYDDGSGKLVGLSVKDRRLRFYSPTTLAGEGSVGVPASVLTGAGAATLSPGKAGSMWIHRDGESVVSVAELLPSAGPRFHSVKLQGVTGTRSLAVEENGNLLLEQRGQLVELLPTGARVKHSYYTGMPADEIVRVRRSFSTVPADSPLRLQ